MPKTSLEQELDVALKKDENNLLLRNTEEEFQSGLFLFKAIKNNEKLKNEKEYQESEMYIQLLGELQEDLSGRGCFDCDVFCANSWGDNTFTFYDIDENIIYVNSDFVEGSFVKMYDSDAVSSYCDPIYYSGFISYLGIEELL